MIIVNHRIVVTSKLKSFHSGHQTASHSLQKHTTQKGWENSSFFARSYPPYIWSQKERGEKQACLNYTGEISKRYGLLQHHYGRFPLKEELGAIAGVSSLYGWVAGSLTLGNLCTLPFPFLALGPISSIMYFHPSIGRLRLKMWVLMKLAICNGIFHINLGTVWTRILGVGRICGPVVY